MGVTLFVVWLIYQILISATTSELILPLTDLVATVTPIKPKSASLSIDEFQHSSLPNVPKLSEVILEYFISQFPETDQNSPILYGYSSPLILTSTSRGLPVPKAEFKQSNNYECLPFCQKPSYDLQCETNFILPSIPLPYSSFASVSSPTSLPVLPHYISENNFIDTSLPYPLMSDMSILNSQLASHTSEYLSPFIEDVEVIPTITVLPKAPLEYLPDNNINLMLESKCSNSFPFYSSPTATLGVITSFSHASPMKNLFSFGTIPSIDLSYSLPYPLRYELLSLPEVVTPNIGYTNFNPTEPYHDYPPYTLKPLLVESYAEKQFPFLLHKPQSTTPRHIYKNGLPITLNMKPVIEVPSTTFYPCSSVQNENSIQFFDSVNSRTMVTTSNSPICICNERPKDPFDIDLPNFEPKSFEFTPVSFEFESTPHFMNHLDCNVDYVNNFAVPNMFPVIDTFMDKLNFNLENNFRECQACIDTFSMPEIPNCFSQFIPLQETCTETIIPEIPSLKHSSNKIIPESCSPVVIYQPTPHTTITPCTFVNVPPPKSSNTIFTVNDLVSNVTKNILSQLSSYWKSAVLKSKYTLPMNPYVVNKSKQNKCATLSAPISITPICSTSLLPLPTQSINVPVIPLSTHCLSNLISPTLYGGLSSNAPYISYSPDLTSELMEMSSSASAKVTILPPSSFADYSPPQPCPTFLPTPTLPSDLHLTVEPIVVKVKTPHKKNNSFDIFLELLFLLELLKNNENVDYNTLNTIITLFGQ